MESFNYLSKINELISIKERRKLLRELQESKKRLLYNNPETIIPFLKNKVLTSDTLQMNHIKSPIVERQIAIPSEVRDSNADYLAQMREHRMVIEQELQALRLEERKSRRKLERRLELLIDSKGTTQNDTVAQIRSMLKSFHEAQVGLHGDLQSHDPILRELNVLKTNYLLDGGRDVQILEEIDSLVKEAERKKPSNINDDMDWIKKRRDMVLLQEKSNALRNLELKNAELERQLYFSGGNQDRINETKRKSKETNGSDRMILLQKQIDDLKYQGNHTHPDISQERISKTPILSARSWEISGRSEFRNFIISIESISGIGQHIRSIGIRLSIYNGFMQIGDPLVIESISVRRRENSDLDYSVLVNISHPVINCPVSPEVFVILELRVMKDFSDETRTEGWAKFPVFTDQGQLNNGRWKESILKVPVQINASSEQLLRIHQFHRSVLHYQLGEYRSYNESGSEASSRNYDKPQIQDSESYPIKNQDVNGDFNSDDDKSDVTVDLDERPEVGFQIIRVKNMSVDDGLKLVKIRMTAYHTDGSNRGQIVMSSEGPVTCSTNAVRADSKISCYNFGRQEARFSNVDLTKDCVLFCRFYLEGNSKISHDDGVVENEEILVAWTAIPLVKRSRIARRNPSYIPDSLKLLRVNKGLHDIALYEPPTLQPIMVRFDRNGSIVGQKSIGRAKLKFRLFHTQLLNESATSSDDTSPDEDADNMQLQEHWIPVDRTEPPMLPYHHDGFDLYVDSGRLFPDSVTITKIEGSIVDRYLNYQGPQLSATSSLWSDIYNPKFNERFEVREPHISPSSTLLLKILTFDREDRNLVVLGYASLKLFVETGSFLQPNFDNLSVLTSLNTGGHQVKIYQTEPTTSSGPFTESWFKDHNIRFIPGASLLLRILAPPKKAKGNITDVNELPTHYQSQSSTIVEAPSYDQRYYYSMDCKPSDGEAKIMKKHLSRPEVKLHDLLLSKWAERMVEGVSLFKVTEKSDILKLFQSLNKDSFNFNHIAHYVPTNGFKISVDCALNLPWSGYPLAFLCLYPPGAIYMKKPLLAYDRPFFVSKLDLTSTFSSPIWINGWKTYRRRKYNKNLVAILHIHEMKISIVKNEFVFTLENEAWTPIRIFDGPYCITKATQMPLLTGSPTFGHLKELANKSVDQFLMDNIPIKKITPLQSSSAIIRQCDSRRHLEISVSAGDEPLTLDQSFLPQANLAAYRSIYQSNKDLQFNSLVPAGFTLETFQEVLSVKFKNLVYKLYDQDGFYLRDTNLQAK